MRLRGDSKGALDRVYLHSGVTASLWSAVVESERLFEARLLHAVMLASLYGNPLAKLDTGNDQVHEMYIGALGSMPYLGVALHGAERSDSTQLVEEWRKLNAGVTADADAGADAGARKEGDDVRR